MTNASPEKRTMPSAVVRMSFICPVTFVARGELISVHLRVGRSGRKRARIRISYLPDDGCVICGEGRVDASASAGRKREEGRASVLWRPRSQGVANAIAAKHRWALTPPMRKYTAETRRRMQGRVGKAWCRGAAGEVRLG